MITYYMVVFLLCAKFLIAIFFFKVNVYRIYPIVIVPCYLSLVIHFRAEAKYLRGKQSYIYLQNLSSFLMNWHMINRINITVCVDSKPRKRGRGSIKYHSYRYNFSRLIDWPSNRSWFGFVVIVSLKDIASLFIIFTWPLRASISKNPHSIRAQFLSKYKRTLLSIILE